MTDCSIAGQDVLAAQLDQFVKELSTIDGDDALQRFSDKRESGNLVRRIADLLGTKNSAEAKASVLLILTVSEDKLRHFPFL